jgi:two-component system phosphate regulon response regulator PhoB
MTRKILVVDDEPDQLTLLEMNLGREGFLVRTAANGAEARAAVRAEKPDLILMDIMLPDVSGIKLAAQLKHSPDTASIPIIMLTAKDAETDMVVSLSVGADDYVTKPFSTAVLLARIEAVLRRGETTDVSQEVLRAGPVRIVPANHQVFVDDKQIELTVAEFTILAALIKTGGAVLSREQLMSQLGSDGVGKRVIPVHISSLRKKLGPAKNIIKTIHGVGYRIEA